jgi:hypothetical protein
MPLDTRIALGVQPLQLENPLASYGQAVGIQNAMQQNQLAQMQMSAAQRAMQDEEGAKNFLSTNPDLSTPENQRRLLAFGKTGLAYGKAISEQQKSKGEADKTAAEVLGLNQKNFTALNPPIRAAAGGIPGITAYVESMYADPVLGKLAARVKTKEQALQENIDMFNKDPNQWITAHSNLDGAQMLDALKMNQERTDEAARIASRMPPAVAPAAPPAAVAPAAPVAPPAAAPAAPEAGITKEISPGVRVNSNLSQEDIARIVALGDKGSMSYPGERWTLNPMGNLISEPIPVAVASGVPTPALVANNLAPPVANVNAMNPNAATMQAINVERTRLEAERNRLLNLRQSKGVQDELKGVEAQLKEINAPVNLRAEGTAFIPGRGTLTAAPTMTETQKEYAIIADPNASKGAKDAATARIAKLVDIPAKSVDGAIERYEYAKNNSGYKGSFTDFIVLSTPKTDIKLSQNAEKSYGTAFGGKIADLDAAKLDAAGKAPDLAANANSVLSILNKGDVFVGPAATVKLNVARVLNAAGASNDEKIANTETLISNLGRNTLGMVKSSGLGTGQGFTDKDLQFLEKVAGGSIDYNEKTLRNLAELAHKAAAASAETWNKRVKEIPASATSGTGISLEPVVVPARITKAAAARPAGVPAEWTLQVDGAGKRAYVSPDGKSFKEVP